MNPCATLVKILNIFTENDKAKAAETKLKYSNVMNDIQKATVRTKHKKVVEELNNHLEFRLRQRAVRNTLKTHEMIVPLEHEYGADTVSFLDKSRPLIKSQVEEDLNELGGVKYQLALFVEFMQQTDQTFCTAVMTHKQTAIMNSDQVDTSLNNAFQEIGRHIENFTNGGSGWSVSRVETLHLNISKYQPLRGASYVDLPPIIKNKKAVINVKNKDNQCIRWALRSALFPAGSNSDRPSSYPINDNLNFDGIGFPTPITDISKIEQQNNLTINVFGWSNAVTTQRLSEKAAVKRINLLLIEKDGQTHYTWIKDLNRLLYDQTKAKRKKNFCERCLQGFTSKEILEKHQVDFNGVDERPIRIQMPDKDKNKIKFTNYQKQMKVPYVIYADFESLLEPITTTALNPEKSNTNNTEHHQACGFCYQVVCSDGECDDPVLYRGENSAEILLQHLEKEEKRIIEKLSNRKRKFDFSSMTEKDWKKYHNSNCWICEKPFRKTIMENADNENYDTATECYKCTEKLIYKSKAHDPDGKYLGACCSKCKPSYTKVLDHCHITGQFRGAAHSSCNIQLRINPKTIAIPVIFHNLRGYDGHLIMQSINKSDGKLSCIPNNMEKYISFQLRQLRFIDSFQFLQTSLDKLVKGCDSFPITQKYEPDDSRRQLLLRKGIYPYEYMSHWRTFEETELPPQAAFYSKLKDETISNDDYKHAQNVWQKFQCKNLGDYHDLYLKTDVMLLADVFEKYRSTCIKQYKLDPAHYYTSPGLSWDALLKKTKIELQLLTDYDKYLFIEKGLKGGVSMVSKRYAKANNKYLDDYDAEKPSSYIQYLDANNLYGWAMSQPLTGNFKWTCKDVAEILNHPAGSNTGYIVEVDLEYPAHLHESHNSYPLAPEKIEVPNEWMSPYQQKLLKKGHKCEVEKLVPTLRNKEKYVTHYRNLQLYFDLGLRIKKIHRVLQFDQSPWMKSYIDLKV